MIRGIIGTVSVAAVLTLAGADALAQLPRGGLRDDGQVPTQTSPAASTTAPGAKQPEAAKGADAAKTPDLGRPRVQPLEPAVQGGYPNAFDGFVSMNSGR